MTVRSPSEIRSEDGHGRIAIGSRIVLDFGTFGVLKQMPVLRWHVNERKGPGLSLRYGHAKCTNGKQECRRDSQLTSEPAVLPGPPAATLGPKIGLR